MYASAEVIIIEREDPSELTIYVMTVTPAPEPKPALKYHFLVPPVDRIHANAATLYYKAMAYEGPDPIGPMSKLMSQNDEEPYQNLFSAPLGKFPAKQAEELVRWLQRRIFRMASRCRPVRSLRLDGWHSPARLQHVCCRKPKLAE